MVVLAFERAGVDLETSESKDKYTFIRIQKTTREALIKLGHKGETYDTIILRLINSYGKGEKKGR